MSPVSPSGNPPLAIRRSCRQGRRPSNFIVGNGAILAPGSAIGTLTFSNTLALLAGGTTLVGITQSPLTNDVVKTLGLLTYGGLLRVTNLRADARAALDYSNTSVTEAMSAQASVPDCGARPDGRKEICRCSARLSCGRSAGAPRPFAGVSQ